MPFYRGDRTDVYPVYYSSYQFEGFFRIAWERLREEGFTHYFFLADDMILNPRLTGENFCERLGLDDHRGFLQYVYPITRSRMTAFWLLPALVAVAGKNGVNWASELPDPNDARDNLAAKGYPMGRFGWHNIRHGFRAKAFFQTFFYFAHRFNRWRRDRRTDLLGPPYPLIHGRVDFMVVPSAAMERFCGWCSVFAAMSVFVEIGAPTALALICAGLITEADTGFSVLNWHTVAESDAYCRPFGNRIDQLLAGFDESVLYMHPIKLSQWQFDARND